MYEAHHLSAPLGYEKQPRKHLFYKEYKFFVSKIEPEEIPWLSL